LSDSDIDIREQIKEIKELLEKISQALGIGAVPPASVISIKERAKKKALEINSKKQENI
jgi:hypothetical protein